MSSRREIQVSESIAHMAADFFARESPPAAESRFLITITRAEISPDLKNITVFFSVLPQSFEGSALVFAKRNRTDFREYVKKHTLMKRVPTIDFEIDYGEKNRQRIDDLTRKNK